MAEMVGGAILSASFQSLFQAIDSREIIDFFEGNKQAELLEKLKTCLLSVEVVLDDAEMKQLRNLSIKNWLEGLKDAAEDAENLLDEISTDALEAKILSAETRTTISLTGVKGFFSAPFNYRERKVKMEKILVRLENFSNQKDVLGLSTVIGERLSRRFPSTCLVEDSEVYGREQDRNVVKKLVLSEKDAKPVYVIPIVGMGGVGKTTLAQAIYNDDEVKKEFQFKSWVCVSEEFDVHKVTKTVLQDVTDLPCDTMDLNQLQVSLNEKLNGKKFFVVLDDVWNENYEDWKALMKPFQDGAKGSKIIVTTRSERVASVLGNSPIHHLKELLFKDCWELFAKHASGNRDFTQDPKLDAIGREIVKKCKGLPLAAKTLGGLLRSTLDVGGWERVLRTDIWDLKDEESNIIPALRVSYYYLPSHLKRCFILCSMFPKACKFEKKEAMVFLWMAEGLLNQSKGNKRMEDVGVEYFDELVSRSFFQRMSDSHVSWFVMHDLLVDLAISISSNCVHFQGVESSRENVTKLRHLTLFDKNRGPHDWVKFNLLEATRLRTFHQLSNGNIPHEVVQDIPLKFKCLRSLTLHDVSKLPDSIGELRHLRYLDLRESSIAELSESVCGLYNLQTLRLSPCKNLKSLPRHMHRLINLRCLSIDKCLVEMPTHMSKLKNLQTLSVFIVGKEDGRRICELKELSDLRGSLCIKNLRNVGNEKDALETKLMNKKYLKEVLLEWGDGDTDSSLLEKLVLENLVPSTSIESLKINHYGGTRFPDWVGGHTYGNMVKLKLLDCEYCTSLPPLGQLSSLKSLTIKGFPAIERVDHGFYGNSATSSVNHFPSLETLEFSDMPNWKEWLPMQTGDAAFPKLEILRITKCPKLVGNFPNSFPSLTELEIKKCGSINCSLPTMLVMHLKLDSFLSLATLGPLVANFKTLEICGYEKLKFPPLDLFMPLERLSIFYTCNLIQSFPMSSFTTLTSLSVIGLENLDSMSLFDGAGQDMAFLSYLYIGSCPNLVFLPAGGSSAPKLASLCILYCEKLKCLPEQMHSLFPSLEDLEIVGCPEVESFCEAGLPTNLRSITLGYCDKLIASRTNWNLTRLAKLEEFSIQGSSEMKCFPEEGLLPTSVTVLNISRLSNLETLDVNGLMQLTSLKRLSIWFCEKLHTIPVEELPTSLEELDILGCPLLLEQTDELKKQISELPNEVCVTITKDDEI